MVKTATAARTTTDLEPIDRLEEKVKRLVDMIVGLRADLQRSAEANARLTNELDQLRVKAADAETATSELSVLRDERDQIRTRVASMLEQLEGI
jgi:FtsZ-binding cell division protein ZapB